MAQNNNQRRRELNNVIARLMAANNRPIVAAPEGVTPGPLAQLAHTAYGPAGNQPLNVPIAASNNGVARLGSLRHPMESYTPRGSSSGSNKKGGKGRRTRRNNTKRRGSKSRRANRK